MHASENPDEHRAVREALQRDARRTRQLPPFDAALHDATMRRIRALSKTRATGLLPDWRQRLAGFVGEHGKPWMALCQGAVAVGGLTLIVAGWHRWSTPAPLVVPGRTVSTRPGETSPRQKKEDAVSAEAPAHGVSFDPGNFAKPDLKFAVLEGRLPAGSAGRFDLESPAGPMRLDCGYPPLAGDGNDAPFGNFNLQVDGQF